MTQVFLTQVPRPDRFGREKDLSSAASIGAVVPLLPSDARPFYLPGPAFHRIKQGLRDFREGDHILYAGGDIMSLVLTTAAIVLDGHRQLSLLRWERGRDETGARTHENGFYLPVPVDFYPRRPEE